MFFCFPEIPICRLKAARSGVGILVLRAAKGEGGKNGMKTGEGNESELIVFLDNLVCSRACLNGDGVYIVNDIRVVMKLYFSLCLVMEKSLLSIQIDTLTMVLDSPTH